jgi:glycine betaine/proline transport system substrate-binding protein
MIARNDFLAANPAAAKFFEVVKIDINDISAAK